MFPLGSTADILITHHKTKSDFFHVSSELSAAERSPLKTKSMARTLFVWNSIHSHNEAFLQVHMRSTCLDA